MVRRYAAKAAPVRMASMPSSSALSASWVFSCGDSPEYVLPSPGIRRDDTTNEAACQLAIDEPQPGILPSGHTEAATRLPAHLEDLTIRTDNATISLRMNQRLTMEISMKEIVSTLTSKGQVTIPVEIRRHLGVVQGDQLSFVIEDDGTIEIKASKYPTVASLAGAAGSLDQPMSWD